MDKRSKMMTSLEIEAMAAIEYIDSMLESEDSVEYGHRNIIVVEKVWRHYREKGMKVTSPFYHGKGWILEVFR